DDQENRQHDHAEHAPAVAPDELAAAAERLARPAPFEHDHRDDQNPPGQGPEARDDQEDEPKGDPEAGQDARDDDRPQLRPNPLEGFGEGQIGAPLTDAAPSPPHSAL